MKKVLIICQILITIGVEIVFMYNSQNKPTIEWVNIPNGTFTMGSPINEFDSGIEEIQHQVTISAFKMSKYEITFEQSDASCDATDRDKPNNNGFGWGKHPVTNISWNDANDFVKWMNSRLPTETEWEYACRAGTTTPFYTENKITTSQAKYNGEEPYENNAIGEYRLITLPVGSFFANAFGLFDMHGNVCDFFDEKYCDSINPKGHLTG